MRLWLYYYHFNGSFIGWSIQWLYEQLLLLNRRVVLNDSSTIASTQGLILDIIHFSVLHNILLANNIVMRKSFLSGAVLVPIRERFWRVQKSSSVLLFNARTGRVQNIRRRLRSRWRAFEHFYEISWLDCSYQRNCLHTYIQQTTETQYR